MYDVSQYNAIGATTFVLPVYYARDQVSSGNYYVSKFDSLVSVNGASVHSGPTVVFPGGPGYNVAAAIALKLDSAITVVSDHNFTVYTYDTARVATISNLSHGGGRVTAPTLFSSSPASVFANQSIIGFYRDNTWFNRLANRFTILAAKTSFKATATACCGRVDLRSLASIPQRRLSSERSSKARAGDISLSGRPTCIHVNVAIAARRTSAAGLSVTTAAP